MFYSHQTQTINCLEILFMNANLYQLKKLENDIIFEYIQRTNDSHKEGFLKEQNNRLLNTNYK
ncbi:unnamed protein product [Paramecium octaurelia]|uniref:Uncharacterized protein n=1 Tax=Paramecium octaurelia TaxID=43137 RepID=A0A8S1WG80_PAROT|nr:unnamed protein product [Paramecium octaurelia]